MQNRRDEPPTPDQDLWSASPDVLLVLEGDRIVAVNDAWTRRFRFPVDETVGRSIGGFVHPDDLGRTMHRLGDVGVDDAEFSNRLRDADGRWLFTRWWVRLVDDQIHVGVRDVTRWVEQRREAEAALQVSATILRTAVDPIIVIDADGTIVELNDSTVELFGYDREHMIDRNVNMLMPEPFRSQHDDYLRRYLTTAEARIIGIGREVVAQRADGSLFPIALAVSEVRTQHQHVFTGIVHDLTERNAQRRALVEANENLEQRVVERTAELEESLGELARSNRDLEQFASVASHDLQAPLRNVRQGLELLDAHLDDVFGSAFDHEANELRQLIIDAVVRMEDLVKGLLEFARLDGPAVATGERVDLALVVADVCAALALDIEEADAEIRVGPLPVVVANTAQVRQVVQNLVANSIRYRSPDRRLKISIDTVDDLDESRPGHATVAVADNGVGIAGHHHQRIFELFRRVHVGSEGMGLGLAICQRIVERHGGHIWVDSERDDGATFFFQLPTPGEGLPNS